MWRTCVILLVFLDEGQKHKQSIRVSLMGQKHKQSIRVSLMGQKHKQSIRVSLMGQKHKQSIWVSLMGPFYTGPRRAVGNVSGTDASLTADPGVASSIPSRSHTFVEIDHEIISPPFRWFIQEGLLSVTSESMCRKYWLTVCSSLPRKSVVRWTDLGRKATKQTNKQTNGTLLLITISKTYNYCSRKIGI